MATPPVPEPQPQVIEQNDRYTVTQIGPDKLSVKFATGDAFEGTVQEVVPKLAKAKDDTRQYADQWKQKAEAVQTPPPPVATPDPEAQLDSFLVERLARGLGASSGDDLKQRLARMEEAREIQDAESITTSFLTQCPEFPGTPEAIEKLTQYMEQAQIPPTPGAMAAAHAYCLATKQYAALPVQQESNARPNPAPILSGGSPEGAVGFDINSAKTEDIRKLYFEKAQKGA